MSIQKFTSQVKSLGLARTNRYEAVIPFPTTAANRDVVEVANLFCDTISLPGINIATTTQRFYGETREMPYERDFEPVTLSFYVDSSMKIRTAFDRWMNMIVDPETRAIGYYNDYVRDMDIYVKTVSDESPFRIRLYEVFPKTIQTIQLDTSSRDIMKLQVTLQYKYWKSFNMNVQGAMNSGSLQSFPRSSYDPLSFITGTGTPYGVFDVFGNPTDMDNFDPPISILAAVPVIT